MAREFERLAEVQRVRLTVVLKVETVARVLKVVPDIAVVLHGASLQKS